VGRRYRQPIAVTLVEGQPVAFTWRSCQYRVHVIATWRLSTRWWEADEAVDRCYFRVMTSNHQSFDLYHDLLTDTWVLDVCHD
jgi:hypothetical protein